MKRFALCMTVGIFIFGSLCPLGAQQGPAQQQPSVNVPAEACAAVQRFVARIDATRAMKDVADREKICEQAKKELEPVLKRFNQTGLLDTASAYAKVSEAIIKAPSTDPKLPELLDQKLKLRTKLLERCQA